MKRFFALSLSVVFLFSACQEGPNGGANSNEEAKLRARVAEYIKAINDDDFEAVSNIWEENAVYKNGITGDLVQGRPEIRQEVKKIFEQKPETTVIFDIESIEFPLDVKSVVRGSVDIHSPKGNTVESNIKLIFQKTNGKWYLLHVNKIGLGVLTSPR